MSGGGREHRSVPGTSACFRSGKGSGRRRGTWSGTQADQRRRRSSANAVLEHLQGGIEHRQIAQVLDQMHGMTGGGAIPSERGTDPVHRPGETDMCKIHGDLAGPGRRSRKARGREDIDRADPGGDTDDADDQPRHRRIGMGRRPTASGYPTTGLATGGRGTGERGTGGRGTGGRKTGIARRRRAKRSLGRRRARGPTRGRPASRGCRGHEVTFPGGCSAGIDISDLKLQ